MNNLIIIPAREKSTRLPGKPRVEINGKSMIRRVYQNAVDSKLGDVIVATESDRVVNHCKKYKIPVIKTSEECASGTDRVAEAYNLLTDKSYENIINLQGDLPFIDTENIKRVLYPLDLGYDVGTLTHYMVEEDRSNPHTVKAIVSFETEKIINDNLISYQVGRAHWFVRAAISGQQHVGIYSYNPDTLEKISKLKPSAYEKTEKLEQLRFLENGLTIGALQTYQLPPEVNTPEDVERATEYAKKHDKKISILDFWPFSWI